jgi:segregation and condensation protein A
MADSNEIKQHAGGQAVSGEEPFIVDEATDDALRLHLDQFEGPFEVLLYLIKAQEIDIFDIPISKITDQYIRFLELMREENLDVAGEFLVMAATLIQIKSKMILPVELDAEEEDIEEEDPRLELVEKLLEYRRYRDIMLRLQALEGDRMNAFARNVKPEIEQAEDEKEFLEVSIYDLIQAFRGVLRYVVEGLPHTIVGEGASIDEKIAYIEEQLAEKQSISWIDLFRECKSRVEIVCCFLAILELCRMRRIRAHQHQSFGDIRLFLITTEAVTA